MAYAPPLPERYVPVRTLDLCSNVLVDVQIPISVGGWPVLLIGAGVVPIVWLAAPREAGAPEWRFVVDEGRSVNPAIQVSLDRQAGEVTILAGGMPILRAKAKSPESVAVTYLNLKPLGLAITGYSTGLSIGGNEFTRNRIERATTGIALA